MIYCPLNRGALQFALVIGGGYRKFIPTYGHPSLIEYAFIQASYQTILNIPSNSWVVSPLLHVTFVHSLTKLKFTYQMAVAAGETNFLAFLQDGILIILEYYDARGLGLEVERKCEEALHSLSTSHRTPCPHNTKS